MNKSASGDIKIKENSWIAKLAVKKLHTFNVAIVIGKTIHLYNVTRPEFLQNERWLKHELCHVRQFEHYGFLNFITLYLWESFNKGYINNRFEVEARKAGKL